MRICLYSHYAWNLVNALYSFLWRVFRVGLGLILLSSLVLPAFAFRTDVPPLPFGNIGTSAPSDFYVVDVTTDSAGNVYAVDWFHSTVSRYTTDGVLQMRIDDPALKFNRRITVDDAGRIYVSVPTAGDQIRVYSAAGTLLNTWNAPGLGEGGIQFVAPDRLYMALNRTDDAVVVYDTAGNELFRFGTTGTAPGQFRLPVDVSVSADQQQVYVVEMAGRRVQEFDANGTFLLQWGSSGGEPGQFSGPRAISMDSSGNLFVSDRNNHRVQKFDANGTFLLQWGSRGREPGQFLEHNGLEVGPDDTVWVAGYHGNDIQRFDNNGTLLDRWQGHVSGPGEFASFGGVAISDERLFIVDVFNNRVQAFDVLTRKFLYAFGDRDNGDATVFNFPRAITTGPSGDLYITDDNAVRRIQPDGTFVRRFPQRPDSNRFPGSKGVAVSSAGILFQADLNNNRMLKWDAGTGEFLMDWGELGSAPGQFAGPHGVALGPDETVYVADASNWRIQRFSQDGVFIEEWSTNTPGSQGLKPQGLAIDPELGLVFVGMSKVIRVFDLAGHYLYEWNWGGSPSETIRIAAYMAIGEDGVLYASDPKKGVHRYIFQRDDDEMDSDGVPDHLDNCIFEPNGPLIPDTGGNIQRDTDGDAYGNLCDGDFNGTHVVDPFDFSLLKSVFGSDMNPDQDLNGNGVVDAFDFSLLKSKFGQPPGPSGLVP